MPVVTFLGEVRKSAGRPSIEIEAETVGRLLAAVESAIGPGLAGLLLKDGALHPDLEVLVNGRNIQFLRMLESPLGPSDRVTIFLGGVRGFPGG
jgi:molybdopterin synthase sulfur carrier subunit